MTAFIISPTETGQDYSSPDLFCFKMPQNDTLNFRKASEKQRQKDLFFPRTRDRVYLASSSDVSSSDEGEDKVWVELLDKCLCEA